MKKFIQLDGERVTLIHNMPFDPVHGFGKTEAELSQLGVLLDDIPDPEPMEGKIPIPYYNSVQGFHYRYEDAPPQPASTADIEALNARIDYIGMMTEVL